MGSEIMVLVRITHCCEFVWNNNVHILHTSGEVECRTVAGVMIQQANGESSLRAWTQFSTDKINSVAMATVDCVAKTADVTKAELLYNQVQAREELKMFPT